MTYILTKNRQYSRYNFYELIRIFSVINIIRKIEKDIILVGNFPNDFKLKNVSIIDYEKFIFETNIDKNDIIILLDIDKLSPEIMNYLESIECKFISLNSNIENFKTLKKFYIISHTESHSKKLNTKCFYLDIEMCDFVLNFNISDIEDLFELDNNCKENDFKIIDKEDISFQEYNISKNPKTRYSGNTSQVINNLIHCTKIFSNCYIGLLLAIALDKKIIFLSPGLNSEKNLINNLYRKFHFVYSNDKITIDKNKVKKNIDNFIDILKRINNIDSEYYTLDKNNIEILNSCPDEFEFKKKLLLDNNRNMFIYNISSKKEIIKDLALIQTFDETCNYEYTKNAILFNLKFSNYLPEEWIFVEVIRERTQQKFEFLKKFGINYICQKVDNYSENHNFKQYGWNIGFKTSRCNKFCFVNCDVFYCDCNWLKVTEELFIEYPVFQNFDYLYYLEDTNLFESKFNAMTYSWQIIYNFNKDITYDYNLCITRDLLKWKGGFINPSSKYSGNYYNMIEFYNNIDACRTKTTNSSLYNLDQTEINFFKTSKGLHIVKNLSKCFCLGKYDTTSQIQDYVIRRFNTFQITSDTKLDTKNNLYRWSRNADGKIIDQTLRYIKSNAPRYSNNELIKITKKYIQEKIKEFYNIPTEENPIIVMTCYKKNNNSFNRSLMIERDIVKNIKEMIDKHLKCPHVFKCITDEKIDGVECIQPIVDYSNKKDWYIQNELYRSELYKDNSTILYLDLDIFIKEDFIVPLCPENIFYMSNHNEFNTFMQLNEGMTLFNSRILKNNLIYKDLLNYMNMSLKFFKIKQDFLISLLLKYNIKIDLINRFLSLYIFDLRSESKDELDYVSEMLPYIDAFHFVGPIKPDFFDLNNNIKHNTKTILEKWIK